MHRITKFDLDTVYNKYVDPRIIEIMKEKVAQYNELGNMIADLHTGSGYIEDLNIARTEKYLEILYSNPAGFELTARMTTNYRCLLNIYIQRHDHRLPEWREFCTLLLEELPHFKEIVDAYYAGGKI